MMKKINKYKTISQIEEETEKVRFVRAFDFARAVALTEFLKSLELEYGENFRIIKANPKILENRDSEQREKIFTFNLWVRFAINDVQYYLQMDENLLFDVYITKHIRIDGKTEISEYAEGMNDIFYNDVEWNAEPETILKLTNNMRIAFEKAVVRNGKSYKREIPAYERKEKQTIYKY